MELFFVTAPEGYVENQFKSVGDITNSGASTLSSGAVVNLPVVPTGATLQHPVDKGTATAPLSPTPVWYKGQEVWTYAFEVTTPEASKFRKTVFVWIFIVNC